MEAENLDECEFPSSLIIKFRCFQASQQLLYAALALIRY